MALPPLLSTMINRSRMLDLTKASAALENVSEPRLAACTFGCMYVLLTEFAWEGKSSKSIHQSCDGASHPLDAAADFN